MDTLQASYREDEEEEDRPASVAPAIDDAATTSEPEPAVPANDAVKTEPEASDDLSPENEAEAEAEEDDEDDPPPKKQKQLSSLTETPISQPIADGEAATVTKTPAPSSASVSKKSKKKNNNVWVTKSTRKGKKKSKVNNYNTTAAEDTVLIAPVTRFPDKTDDGPEMKICLSKVYKAEKVELSDDRLSAGSTKGYRMVRSTRGVVEGTWYFEIKVVNLGETGHTRLGFSTEKGDLQAPVGYDGNSFGYRDIDGSKVHKALREAYGEEGYKEGDVIGFYINLPDGAVYAPKDPQLVVFKGQRYACAGDAKDDSPKPVPGSEISFFKNGVCQGIAFRDLPGGRYYPAASMYTLPNQPNCVVNFNFGPEFDFFPQDFEGRPGPRPMAEVPYHGFDFHPENGESNEKKP